MTPRPAGAPAAIAATTLALRATAVATTAAACSPPGDQSTSKPTTTDEKWGQIRPSRWGQRKSSFSRVRAGRGDLSHGRVHGIALRELLALSWRDVHFAGSVIRVRASYAAGALTTPKSGKVRSVPMASAVDR